MANDHCRVCKYCRTSTEKYSVKTGKPVGINGSELVIGEAYRERAILLCCCLPTHIKVESDHYCGQFDADMERIELLECDEDNEDNENNS